MLGPVETPPDPTPLPQPTWLRWAFVGMSALLTIVLTTSVVANFLGARELTDTVVRGQSAMLFHIAQRLAPPGPPPPRQRELQAVLEEGADLGLHYVALLRPSGDVVAEAGEAAPGFSDEARHLRDGDILRRDGLVRATAPAGSGRGPGDGPPGPPPLLGKRPPLIGKGLRGGPRPPLLVIEFEPTMVTAMEQRARRDLAIGLAAIAVLWGAAALFWRLATRAAAAEAKLVSQRHLASLGEMSAIVAHELRNPLASLKGHAQLLLEQADDPRLVKKAQRVVDEAVRLQDVSSGLLEFVRSGRVERSPHAVAEVARQAAAASIAEVDLALDDAPGTWTFDAARIRQVLANLLDNAHHAAPDERASLRVEVRGNDLVFVVRDRGPGVPREAREQIFAPFHTGRTQGTGLGLSVARRIVELHHGTLTCDEHPDGGAVFTVVIPRSV
jgi:two-component system sensor histidine kinase HydH